MPKTAPKCCVVYNIKYARMVWAYCGPIYVHERARVTHVSEPKGLNRP